MKQLNDARELSSLQPGDRFKPIAQGFPGEWLVTNHSDLDDTYCVLCVRLSDGHAVVFYKDERVHKIPPDC